MRLVAEPNGIIGPLIKICLSVQPCNSTGDESLFNWVLQQTVAASRKGWSMKLSVLDGIFLLCIEMGRAKYGSRLEM